MKETDRRELSFWVDGDLIGGLETKSIPDAIQYLLELQDQVEKKGYHTTRIEFIHESSPNYYDGYDDQASLVLYGIRYENDDEYEKRLKKLADAKMKAREKKKKQQAEQDARDRELYEKLKLRFG